MARTIFVLGGGNALGAYHAGAFEALASAGVEPDWIVGSSIGAVTGAIIIGNSPEQRIARLRQFWSEAATKTMYAGSKNDKLRQYYNSWHAAWAMLAGRPSLYGHRWPGLWSALPGAPNDVAIFDHAPLKNTLERLIDFKRLNSGETRLSICCVDIESGAEAHFHTGRDEIRTEHLLACTAIAPLFPPVEIGGKLLCDAGFANNTPVDMAFTEAPEAETICILVELFRTGNHRPASLDASIERAQDILFASQTRRAISGLMREFGLREALDPNLAQTTIAHLAYQSSADEIGLKTFDYSPSSIRDRWASGQRDAQRALERLASRPRKPGLTYLPYV